MLSGVRYAGKQKPGTVPGRLGTGGKLDTMRQVRYVI